MADEGGVFLREGQDRDRRADVEQRARQSSHIVQIGGVEGFLRRRTWVNSRWYRSPPEPDPHERRGARPRPAAALRAAVTPSHQTGAMTDALGLPVAVRDSRSGADRRPPAPKHLALVWRY